MLRTSHFTVVYANSDVTVSEAWDSQTGYCATKWDYADGLPSRLLICDKSNQPVIEVEI